MSNENRKINECELVIAKPELEETKLLLDRYLEVSHGALYINVLMASINLAAEAGARCGAPIEEMQRLLAGVVLAKAAVKRGEN